MTEASNFIRHIQPSARKSIHNHHNCPFKDKTINQPNSNKMVRYGLNSDREVHDEAALQDNSDEGYDEVDNVMSKIMNKSTTPITLNRRTPNSPKISPWRHKHSSLDDESFSNNESLSTDKSLSTSHQSESDLDSKKSQYEQKQRKSNTVKKVPYNIICFFLIISTIIYSFVKVPVNVYYDRTKFKRELFELGETYHIQNDALLKLESGITHIAENEDASSFIFVYNSKNPKENTATLYSFFDKVADLSAKYLRNTTSEVSYVAVENKDLTMKSHGDLVIKYRDILTTQGVMLVKQLLDVPSYLAMAFHYYCDEYDPLVKKSAIFFTLDLDDCLANSETTISHKVLEKCLTRRWNSLPSDILKPLLTRVVNVVVDVTT